MAIIVSAVGIELWVHNALIQREWNRWVLAAQGSAEVPDKVGAYLRRIEVDGLFGYEDGAGNQVVSPKYSVAAETFSDGLAPVREVGDDAHYGYIDTSGRWIIPPKFDLAEEFRGGVGLVTTIVDGWPLHGYVDRTGAWVVPARYEIVTNPVAGRVLLSRQTWWSREVSTLLQEYEGLPWKGVFRKSIAELPPPMR